MAMSTKKMKRNFEMKSKYGMGSTMVKKTKFTMNVQGFLILAWLGTVSMVPLKAWAGAGHNHPAATGETVEVSPMAQRNLGLRFAKVQKKVIERVLALPGRFELDPTAQHHYPMPSSGRVKVLVEHLQVVKRGDLLLELDSPSWRKLQLSLVEAKAELLKAEVGVKRAKAVQKASQKLMGSTVRSAQVSQDSVGDEGADLYALELAVAESEYGSAQERLEQRLLEASTLSSIPVSELKREVNGKAKWQALMTLPIVAVEDGVVREIDASSGTWVAEGTEVVHLVSSNKVNFLAKALQRDVIDHLEDGQEVVIYPPKGHVHRGHSEVNKNPAEHVHGASCSHGHGAVSSKKDSSEGAVVSALPNKPWGNPVASKWLEKDALGVLAKGTSVFQAPLGLVAKGLKDDHDHSHQGHNHDDHNRHGHHDHSSHDHSEHGHSAHGEGDVQGTARSTSNFEVEEDLLRGKVRIGVTGDSGTRTIDVYVDIDVDALPHWVHPKVTSVARVVVSQPQATALTAVPESALINDGLETICFRRDPFHPNTVIKTPVQRGESDGRWTQVVSKLRLGDEVVVDGVYQLMLAASAAPPKAGHMHADGTWHDGDH